MIALKDIPTFLKYAIPFSVTIIISAFYIGIYVEKIDANSKKIVVKSKKNNIDNKSENVDKKKLEIQISEISTTLLKIRNENSALKKDVLDNNKKISVLNSKIDIISKHFSSIIPVNDRIENEVNLTTSLPSDKNTYSLDVLTSPKDSRVRIMNIAKKYKKGIKLKSGNYKVVV